MQTVLFEILIYSLQSCNIEIRVYIFVSPGLTSELETAGGGDGEPTTLDTTYDHRSCRRPSELNKKIEMMDCETYSFDLFPSLVT